MREMRSLLLVPVLGALVAMQACGSSSSPSGASGAGATQSVAGAVGVSGSFASSAGSPAVSNGGSPSTASGGGGDTSTAGGSTQSGGGAGTATGGSNTSAGAGGKGGSTSGGAGGQSSSGGSAGAVASGGAAGGGPTGLTALGKYVLTWYSFQDNTPVNSLFSASGHILVPYVSVAVPFTRLKNCVGLKPPAGKTCGTLSYGDKLYVDFLKDRKMPNGMLHTGWVMVDDYCGDGGDDTYCYQDGGDGKTYPNVDIYIGDFAKSGMAPSGGDCTGPAGDGGQLFNLSSGNPGAAFITNYGGAAVGTGKCGDRQTARDQQYGPPAGSPFGLDGKSDGTTTACWGYDGQGPDTSDCSMCMPGITCAK